MIHKISFSRLFSDETFEVSGFTMTVIA